MTACGDKDVATIETAVDETSSVAETTEVESETQTQTITVETEEESTIVPDIVAEHDMVTFTSDIGYSIEYDQSIFTISSSYGMDEISFSGEDLPSPVFILVQNNDILSAESIADGMESSSDVNDVYRTVANFGADNMEVDLITYRYSVMDEERTMTCYIIPTGENSSWLVEVGGYDDIPAVLQEALDETIDSFTIIE
jgi:hypothetical protein